MMVAGSRWTTMAEDRASGLISIPEKGPSLRTGMVSSADRHVTRCRAMTVESALEREARVRGIRPSSHHVREPVAPVNGTRPSSHRVREPVAQANGILRSRLRVPEPVARENAIPNSPPDR